MQDVVSCHTLFTYRNKEYCTYYSSADIRTSTNFVLTYQKITHSLFHSCFSALCFTAWDRGGVVQLWRVLREVLKWGKVRISWRFKFLAIFNTRITIPPWFAVVKFNDAVYDDCLNFVLVSFRIEGFSGKKMDHLKFSGITISNILTSTLVCHKDNSTFLFLVENSATVMAPLSLSIILCSISE